MLFLNYVSGRYCLIFAAVSFFLGLLSFDALAENRSPNMQTALAAIDADDYVVAMREFRIVLDNPKNDTKINVSVANYNIGYMLANGLGVEKNLSEAVKYYRIAAEGGLHMAQNTLGVLLIKGHGVVADEIEGWQWIRKAAINSNKNAINALRRKCLSSVVPNPRPLPDESTLFYGDCENGRAINGIVFWQVKGVSYTINCLNNGSYMQSNRTDGFDNCKPYWFIVPDFCEYKNYSGQCKDGLAQGLGVEVSRTGGTFGDGTMSIRNGQFEKGELNGYAYYTSISGCGYAGCSGNHIEERGWFKNGNKIFYCDVYTDCLKNLSGKDFININKVLSPEDSKKIQDLRNLNTFESIIEAFNLTGDKDDLKRAQNLAKSKQQKATLEYTLMRVAGFDKVFLLSANVVNGEKSLNLNESEHLLGFMQSVSASLPVKIKWKLSSNPLILPLQYGAYEIKLKVGIDVMTSAKTCIGIFCNNRVDKDEYSEKYNLTLTRNSKYTDAGVYDLSVKSSHAASVFVGSTLKAITGVTPIISIESVTPIP